MFQTLLRDEKTQQDQPAGGIRDNQPEQYNGISKEHPHLADCAAQEQHNLSTGPEQKTSKGDGPLLLAVWDLHLLRTSGETPPQLDIPHQANTDMLQSLSHTTLSS